MGAKVYASPFLVKDCQRFSRLCKVDICRRQGTLEYACTCLNKSSPANIALYQGTIPNYLCQRAYSQCTTGVEGLSSSERCRKCGTLQPSNVPDSASPTKAASPSTEASLSGSSTSQMGTAPTTEATPATLPTASPETGKSSPATTGLSSPAKIGVGVGVSLGVVSLAIIIVGLVLLRRRRNRRPKAEDKAYGGGAKKSGTTNKPVMQELDGDGDDAGIGSGVRELDAIESPPKSRELTGSPGPLRYELE